MVADLHLLHAGADLAHDACAFVTDHRRQLARTDALDGGQIGMTEAGGGHLDQDFAGTGALQVDLLDSQRLRHRERMRQALLEQQGGGHFHGGPPNFDFRQS